MKKNFTAATLLVFTFFISACKKDQNSLVKVNPLSILSHHAYGVMTDQKPPSNIPHADLYVIKSSLIKAGYLSNLQIDGTPPSSIVLNHPTIGNQGTTNTCVSWSIGYALAGTLNLQFPIGLNSSRSPWFIYQMYHTSVNDKNDDGMPSAAAGMSIFKANGIPPYSLDTGFGNFWQYTPTTYISENAALDKTPSYSSLSTVSDIKTALSMKLPVEIAINVYQSFEDAFNKNTIFKANSGALIGGHAVCIIGYDDSKNAVLVQNSWGVNNLSGGLGGDAKYPGCMWLDYGMLTNNQFVRECYVVTPPAQSIAINGLTSVYWSANGSSNGLITAVPGTTIHVGISAYGSSTAQHLVNFTLSGAQLTGPMGSNVYVNNGHANPVPTFVMPSNGSASWSGYFSESDTNGSGEVYVY